MNDFFSDLFEVASNPRSEKLAEYDEDDLRNFFEGDVEDPRKELLRAAGHILNHLDDPGAASDMAKAIGLSGKNAEKLAGFVKNQIAELRQLSARMLLNGEETLKSFDWSVRSVVFSKRDEFKGQKKYAILDFEVDNQDKGEKLKLNCSKENIMAIRGKLGKLDETIRQMFEEGESS